MTELDNGTKTYTPKLTYQYSVGAKEYVGRQISFGAGHGYFRKSDAEAIVNLYPLDAEVTVYYKQDDPSQAVIEPGASPDLLWMPLGIAIFGFAVFSFIFAQYRKTFFKDEGEL